MASRPLVIIPCDHRQIGGLSVHLVGEKYILGAAEGAGALPLLLPVLERPLDPAEVLALADGLLLTGSPSNVAPHRYDGAAPRPGTRLDERRDETNFALIAGALGQGVPLLAICRGLQELNVALGGTLLQHVQEQPGRLDHRAKNSDPIEVQYGPAHPVIVVPGGLLAGLAPTPRFDVNSLHSQGIDRLASGLIAEAHAPDGQIEAVRVAGAKAFALGVQWHPEWEFWKNPVSRAILGAFGEAIRARAKTKGSDKKDKA
jgi:putative glutamine amidotransferase